jgi:hypothetical protein
MEANMTQFRILVTLTTIACGLVSSPALATPPMGVDLADKTAVFQQDMIARFIHDGQVSPKLRLPSAQIPFISYNMPDNAYMTGIYLGVQSMRWAVTGDPEAKQQASAAILALDHLTKVTGVPGLLARASVLANSQWYDNGTWRPSDDGVYMWRGDVSSDQVDGVMFGYYLAYNLVADAAERAMIAENAAAVIDHIIANDYRIVGYDGEPTTWGKYYPDYVNNYENMNALLMLQHLKVAYHVTGEQRFLDAYWDRIQNHNYADIAVTARVMGDPLVEDAVNHSDDVLQFLAYLPLLSLETDTVVRGKYLASLQRSWEGAGGYPGTKPESNPIYNFLCHAFLNDASGDAAAITTLERFPLDMKFNSNTITAYETLYGFTFDPTPVSPAPGPTDPVPIDHRPKTWSAWVDDPYTSGTRTTDGNREYTGHEYLLGYWLGRYFGYLDPDSRSAAAVQVDLAAAGVQDGSTFRPFDTVAEALIIAPSGGRLRIAGDSSIVVSSATFSGASAISWPIILEANPAGSGVRLGVVSKGLLTSDGINLQPAASDPGSSSGTDPAWTDKKQESFRRFIAQLLRQLGAGENDSDDADTIREGRVRANVLPYTRAEDGSRLAWQGVPIAIRLHSDGDFDHAGVWASGVPGTFEVEEVEAGDTCDVWVIVSPDDEAYFDEVLTVSIGALNTDGTAVEVPPYAFQTDPDAPVQTLPALPEGGVAEPQAIEPERVYAEPQRVWLPVPSGRNPNSLQIYYYHAEGDEKGWYLGEQVDGWLVPGSREVISEQGETYIGYLVRHAGVVQLGDQAE